jgi:transcriptional regulator with XRE-family HTH domain
MKTTGTPLKRERLINKAMRAARLKHGMTQGEVCKLLGLDNPQYLSNIERGLCSPSIETVNVFVKNKLLTRHNAEDLLMKEYRINLWRKMASL